VLHKQICIFIENKKGRLAEVTKVLGDGDINLRALSIADTTDFGILRLIVDKPDDAERALTENGFTVSITSVIAMSVPDKPGGLSEALGILDRLDINIEYLYAFIGKNSNMAVVIMRVNEPAEAVKKIMTTPITLLTKEELDIL